MINKKNIVSIWIEYEESENELIDYYNNNTDVIVKFNNGSKYIASFFSYRNIDELRKKNEETGECLSGSFFWASDMILIDNCSRESIINVINYLLNEDEFEFVFKEVT